MKNENSVTHPQQPTPERKTLLFDGYAVSVGFFDMIKQQVTEVVLAMERGEPYTLEAICGSDFWGQLSSRDRKMAGRCMASMVVTNILPLAFVEWRHEYPKKYMRK